MSMNIYVEATAKSVIFGKNGKQIEREYSERFDLWQTRTDATYKILESENKLEAYIDWLRKIFPNDTVEIDLYSDDDYFQLHSIGKRLVASSRRLHEDELKEWIKSHEDFFEIKWYML